MRLSLAVVGGMLLLVSVVACGDFDHNNDTAVQSKQIVGGYDYSGLPAVGAFTYVGQPICTGTLITSDMVVTAAHCLENILPYTIRFVIGEDAWNPEYTLEVESVHVHPDFIVTQTMIKNDIGYVKLKETAPIAPINTIANMNASWVGTELLFIGYGHSNGRSQTGNGKKRAVSIEISEMGETKFVYEDPEVNTCNGDSGGPAFFVDGENYYLVGLTSYGDRYCSIYGVDTRVDVFFEWLSEGAKN